MDRTWDPGDGVVIMPSGRRIRGRALSNPLPPGRQPEFGLYLLGSEPPGVDWDARWLRWPDFRLPADKHDAVEALTEAWRRAETERVEVACRGGRGRTGTALACIAILDGVPPAQALSYVRRHYHRRAVETPWQRWYVKHFQRQP